MNEVDDLVEISKYAGERFDLVQAAGGNSSVKFDNGEMIIKASGFTLSDVNKNHGYSRVVTEKIATITKTRMTKENGKRQREELTAQLIKEATKDKDNRPSIETLLHSFLYKYTLHTHPVAVNAIVIQESWSDTLCSIFKDEHMALIEYDTPGIELAIKLDEELAKFDSIPKIIFLQNHGLIVTSDDKLEIFEMTEFVISAIENHLGLNLERYKLTNKITALLNEIHRNNNISYLCEDAIINNQLAANEEPFVKTPFCPDSLVYCGMCGVVLSDIFDVGAIKDYFDKYSELPKIVILENQLFIVGKNVRKAKEIEEVLKFNIMVRIENNEKINYLTLDELGYLSNWEAEKFRQTKT